MLSPKIQQGRAGGRGRVHPPGPGTTEDLFLKSLQPSSVTTTPLNPARLCPIPGSQAFCWERLSHAARIPRVHCKHTSPVRRSPDPNDNLQWAYECLLSLPFHLISPEEMITIPSASSLSKKKAQHSSSRRGGDASAPLSSSGTQEKAFPGFASPSTVHPRRSWPKR